MTASKFQEARDLVTLTVNGVGKFLAESDDVKVVVDYIHSVFAMVGVPPPYPNAEQSTSTS
jgi:hypothetical protein